jgi:hypothetical protein
MILRLAVIGVGAVSILSSPAGATCAGEWVVHPDGSVQLCTTPLKVESTAKEIDVPVRAIRATCVPTETIVMLSGHPMCVKRDQLHQPAWGPN